MDYLILLYGARFSGHIRDNRGMLTSFQFCLVNLQFKILCQIVWDLFEVLGIFTAYTLKKLKAQKSQLFNKIQAAQSQSQISIKPLAYGLP